MPSVLGKRKRSDSSPDLHVDEPVYYQSPESKLALPLTMENLEQFNLISVSDTVMSSPQSHTKSPTLSISLSRRGKIENEFYQNMKLLAHNVYKLRNVQLPERLQQLIDQLSSRPREAVSPNTKNLTRLQSVASRKNVADGFRLIQDDLLYLSGLKGGEYPLDIATELNFTRAYRPPYIPSSVSGTYNIGLLESPQPDCSVGYMTSTCFEFASEPFVGQEPPFTPKEELILHQLGKLCDSIHIPFLTCEWKIHPNDATPDAEQYQAAKTGAFILNYLMLLSKVASASTPIDITKVCHFSMTCDLESACVYIYIHWPNLNNLVHGSPSYEMNIISRTFLTEEIQVQNMRKLIRNLADWAFEVRLPWIKSLLSDISPRLRDGEDFELSMLRLLVKSPRLPNPSTNTIR